MSFLMNNDPSFLLSGISDKSTGRSVVNDLNSMFLNASNYYTNNRLSDKVLQEDARGDEPADQLPFFSSKEYENSLRDAVARKSAFPSFQDVLNVGQLAASKARKEAISAGSKARAAAGVIGAADAGTNGNSVEGDGNDNDGNEMTPEAAKQDKAMRRDAELKMKAITAKLKPRGKELGENASIADFALLPTGLRMRNESDAAALHHVDEEQKKVWALGMRHLNAQNENVHNFDPGLSETLDETPEHHSWMASDWISEMNEKIKKAVIALQYAVRKSEQAKVLAVNSTMDGVNARSACICRTGGTNNKMTWADQHDILQRNIQLVNQLQVVRGEQNRLRETLESLRVESEEFDREEALRQAGGRPSLLSELELKSQQAELRRKAEKAPVAANDFYKGIDTKRLVAEA